MMPPNPAIAAVSSKPPYRRCDNSAIATADATDKPEPDWTIIQSWLQNAAMELDYLVWLVIAKRTGSMPEEAPTLFKIEADLEEEPLAEGVIRRRLKEIADLAEGWRTNDGFPQF